MAITQSAWASGRKMPATSGCAAEVVAQKFSTVIAADKAIGDIIELGVLPAEHDAVDVVILAGAMGTGVTIDVGIMSGAYGDTSQARTSGAEFHADVDVAAASVTRMTLVGGFTVDSGREDRSIGVKFGGAITTAADQLLVAMVLYRQK